MADGQATGGYWDVNNVWRPPTGDDPRPFNPMDELWRYAHDPDLLSADVARWAYDRIRALEGAAGAGGREAGAQAPIRGRWRTGTSVRPRVTLYRDDQIVGLALTGELAAEIVDLCNRQSATDRANAFDARHKTGQ